MAPKPERTELNFSLLVERMVPLVAELFATLASQDPLRMHFADIAGKTLLDIVETLRDEGMSQEAIAASLDMSISGFRSKLKRLRESYQAEDEAEASEQRPATLLERIYATIADAESGVTTYATLETQFRGTKTDTLRGVLTFLVQSGLVSVTGRGRKKEYRPVPRRTSGDAGYVDTVVTLYREGPLTMAELAARLEVPEAECEAHVERLRADGRLEETIDAAGTHRFRAIAYHIPMDSAAGYESALWDHFHAVVRAICRKVRLRQFDAKLHDVIGGTTFSFDVPESHPLYAEISGFLRETRERMEAWLEKSTALEGTEASDWRRITIYAGQNVDEREDRG